MLRVHGREPRGQEDGRQHKDPSAAQVRRSENQPNQQMKANASLYQDNPTMHNFETDIFLGSNQDPTVIKKFHNGMTKKFIFSEIIFYFSSAYPDHDFKANKMSFLFPLSMNPDGWRIATDGGGRDFLLGRANANNVDLNR